MRKLILLFACISLFSCQDEHSKLQDGLYADIETVKGHIVIDLEFVRAPVTVANFVTLAEGKNPYVSANLKGKPFYDGLKFHRVEPNFVIQGGDPDGNGSGGPGYKFIDEITDLKHDRAGTLSMANSGPGTNGSQFFITHQETPHLDGRHTVFGYVVGNGMETVNKIVKDDGIISVKIIRKGAAAKKFDAVKVFTDYFVREAENKKKEAQMKALEQQEYEKKYSAVIAKKKAYFESLKGAVRTTASGLQYKTVAAGNGKKPNMNSTVYINYAGYFSNAVILDTNIEATANQFGKFNETRKMEGGYNPMPFQYGRKTGLIPGFIEGIELMSIGEKAVFFVPAALGYGEAGSEDGFIPPNADLIFELELLDKVQK
ncbi:peptidylprolyl isomerase [Flavobacterium magnum]|uniref:peptidylprolyl isomerase n=1 Tax=Flavobacterium magnum TaxID=2162713 RepID=A0A2S0RGZ0_9FLAO|nr:peptidylprolyl isomerase [Flavobacterium magnum]AWA31197.1 peptidylprolyl isomerase [Flavobacterium magnum]